MPFGKILLLMDLILTITVTKTPTITIPKTSRYKSTIINEQQQEGVQTDPMSMQVFIFL